MSAAVNQLSVTLRDVGRAFPTEDGTSARVILRDVNLEVQPGEILSIIGASGSGKSTLLRAVAGLDTDHTGQLLIGDRAVKAYDERTAVGFQEPRLLPWKTIADNVALGLPRATDSATGTRRVAELLELVGLSHVADHRPREVSGGMAQRTSLARALARNPGVLLLDEPFGALDALTRIKMQDLLLDVHRSTPTTILLVTHDVDEALALSDRVLLLGSDHSSAPGTTTQALVTVPGSRPRDRSAPEILALREQLFAGLGVDTHHTTEA